MTALSIDTSANLCAVSLSDLRSGVILASISNDIGRGHGEILMGSISRCLDEADRKYGDIRKIIATTGPGSFAGLRVGLATARAIALALQCPIVGVSDLAACARHATNLSGNGKLECVTVVLDARRGEVYFQQFENDNAQGEACVISLHEAAKITGNANLDKIFICGSGADKLSDALLTQGYSGEIIVLHRLPTAPIAVIAEIGLRDRFHGEASELPEPLYLRGPDAKQQQGFAVRWNNGKGSEEPAA